MLTGWFPVDRELLSSDLWLSEKFTRGQAWVDLVGLARFKPGYVRLQGKRIDLKRGQIAWSQRELARRWRWSKDKVHRYLDELEADQFIRFRSVGVTTVITIVCYDSPDIPAPAERPAIGQQVATKEQRQHSQQRQPPTEEWGEIQWALKELGIAAAATAVDAARSHHVSPNEVREWIEEYRAKMGAWGPGALVSRLTGKLADWPPPSEEYLKAHAREQFARDSARQAAKRVERREAQTRQRQGEEELDRNFGPLLDRLNESDRAALEFAAIPDAAERTLSRRLPNAHRARLLTALAEQVKAHQPDAA